MAADPSVTLVVSLAVVAGLVGGCNAETGREPAAGDPSTSLTQTSPSPSLPMLDDGPVTPGRYVVVPPAVGWAECSEWAPDCPPEPTHARSLQVEITIPPGWEAAGSTVIVPRGLDEGSSEGPDGAGLVMGWTTPSAGLNSDPCLPVPHMTPDIMVGPTVDEFVDAVLAHPSLKVSDAVDVKPGGYRGQFLQLTAPSDISDCEAWRPFEGGIYAQGRDNLWSIWVIDVDGLRMVVLAEEFAGTPAKDKAELRSMVESIRFLP